MTESNWSIVNISYMHGIISGNQLRTGKAFVHLKSVYCNLLVNYAWYGMFHEPA